MFPTYSSAIGASVDDMPGLSLASLDVQDGYDLSASSGLTLTITGSMGLVNKHASAPTPFAIPIASSSSPLTIQTTGPNCATCGYPVSSTISDPNGSVTLYAPDQGFTPSTGLEFVRGGISSAQVAVNAADVTLDSASSFGTALISVTNDGVLTVGRNMTLPNAVDLMIAGDAGTLVMDDHATLAGHLNVSGSGLQSNLIVGSGDVVSGAISGNGFLVVRGTASTLTLSGANSLTYALWLFGSSLLTVVATSQQAFGTASIGVLGNVDVQLDAGPSTWHNSIDFSPLLGAHEDLHVVGNVSVTWAGEVSTSQAETAPSLGALASSGSLTLSGTIYGSAPSVDGSGVVLVTGSDSFDSQRQPSFPTVVTGPARLILDAPSGTVAWAGSGVTLQNGAVLEMAPGTDGELSIGVTVDQSTLDIGATNQTIGSLVIKSSPTIVGSGTLGTDSITDNNQIPTTSAATADFIDVGAVYLSGGMAPTITSNVTLLVIDSVLEGTTGVTVSQTYTEGVPVRGVDFVADNTSTGTTQVNGLLYIDGHQPQSPVQLGTAASLSGNGGTVGDVSMALNNTSWLEPDGTLTMSSLNMNANSKFTTDLYGTRPGLDYGQVVSSGVVSLDDSTLTLGFGAAFKNGDTFTLISVHPGGVLYGTFAGLPEGQHFDIGPYVMSITYRGGAGHDVVLKVISSLSVTYGGWQSLGGSIIGKPAAAGTRPGQMTVVAVAPDHSLWTRSLAGGHWSGWSGLGGYSAGDPALASWGAGRLDLFVRGADHALWHKWANNGVWSGWEKLGGVLSSGPAATSWGPNRLDVVVQGADGAAWHMRHDGSGWSVWQSLGGTFLSPSSSPAIGSWGVNRLDVVVTSNGGNLEHISGDGEGWGPWEDIGGRSSYDPAVVATEPGALEVAAVGTDQALWHQGYDGEWFGWSGLGGRASSAPALASWGGGNAEILVRGTDGGVWYASGAIPKAPAQSSARNALRPLQRQLAKPPGGQSLPLVEAITEARLGDQRAQ